MASFGAMMILQLPDGDYYRGHGDDIIDPEVSTSYGLLDMVDTEDEEDSGSFSGDAAGTVNIDDTSDYLIFFSGEGTRASESQNVRANTQIRLYITGATSTYGGGWYDRGEQSSTGTFEGGTSFGSFQSLTDTDYISFYGRQIGDAANGQFEANQYGISLINFADLLSRGGGGSAESDYLRATNFDFSSIPSGATIEGITVEIDKYAEVTDSIKDFSIQLRNSTGPKGANRPDPSFWDDSDSGTYTVYGGSNDKWSESWTVAEIDNIDFGVDIVADTTTSSLAYIDHIVIKVNYTQSLSGQLWQDTTKVTSQDNDNTIASFDSTTEDTSDILKLSDFNFVLSDTAQITGIEVRVDRESDVSDTIKDVDIRLTKTTGPVGTSLHSGQWWDTSDSNYDIYGGISEMWGTSWDYLEVNDLNFGIELFIEYFDTVSVEARIDHLQIKIHYAEPPTLLQGSENVYLGNPDISAQWEGSAGGSHYDLINEGATPNLSDFIFTTSDTTTSVIDDLNMENSLNILSGNVTESTVRVFGNETSIGSTIKVDIE